MFGFTGFSDAAYGSPEGLWPGTWNGEIFSFSLTIKEKLESELSIFTRPAMSLEIDMKKQFDLEIE